MKTNEQLATFGAGCFWGPEFEFGKVLGVIDTAVGYMGGSKTNPTYEQVCSGNTGHTEVVQIKFDPDKVSYEELLDIFWNLHDPTQINSQGPDVGWQYRSVIFYHNDEQKKLAGQAKDKLNQSGKYSKPIATTLEEAQTFWLAEDYHQHYIEKTGRRVC